MSCLNERNEDIWYCCEEHLLLHRKKANDGEARCYPIKVLHNDKVGRYKTINDNKNTVKILKIT